MPDASSRKAGPRLDRRAARPRRHPLDPAKRPHPRHHPHRLRHSDVTSWWEAIAMNATPAGAWVRVSSGGQDEANQVPDLERYCAEHGYTIITRYDLNDRSAYKGEQEAKQQEALADTRSGVVKVVVVWASDRIERRGAEATLAIFRKFREAGGRLESVQEPFLSGKPEDAELMTAITGWKDRAESAGRRANGTAELGAPSRPGHSRLGFGSWPEPRGSAARVGNLAHRTDNPPRVTHG